MNNLIIINDPPYTNDKPFNALTLAIQILNKQPKEHVRIFLMADASECALKNQGTHIADYNLENMMKSVMASGAEIKVCNSHLIKKGFDESHFIEGSHLCSMDEMTNWFIESDKIISF